MFKPKVYLALIVLAVLPVAAFAQTETTLTYLMDSPCSSVGNLTPPCLADYQCSSICTECPFTESNCTLTPPVDFTGCTCPLTPPVQATGDTCTLTPAVGFTGPTCTLTPPVQETGCTCPITPPVCPITLPTCCSDVASYAQQL